MLAYGLVMTVYRLHFHPLSKFPGPKLASLSGLYEIYFTAWGAGSFEEEIDRMHQIYGPVVRITPDEVHVQEQFYNPSYADGLIKGTRALDFGRHQPGRASRALQSKKRSISRARSILQLEVHQIIRGLVQKHQKYRLFGSRIQSFIPLPELHEVRIDLSDESDLEDGHHQVVRRSSISKPQSGSSPDMFEGSDQESSYYLPAANGPALYSTLQSSGRSLPV
ncbi:hypothetical protein N7456_005035 [Penicillium angulare]|uniref:Uncharacterized protein n=1 Tax=Penicillium angulare TaxID=116970 RepID=A0A9W9KJ56_9EURO|nr:hypothetical protein N7456_005035 [Penicillium angulare]